MKQKGHHRLARWSFVLAILSELVYTLAFFDVIPNDYSWVGWITGILLFIGFYNLFSLRHLEQHAKILYKDIKKDKERKDSVGMDQS